MLGHAALAPAAMLAPQRRSDHASDTEMRLVVLPLVDQFVDHGLLLRNTIELRYKPRVINHGSDVEKARKDVDKSKQKVPQPCPICGASAS